MAGLDFSKMARALRDGHYNLLLGSGISLDSSNALGTLPGVGTLKKNLCELKSARESSSLQRVYSTLTKNEVDKHVTRFFRESKAGPSIKNIPSFIWKRIFTFNIDDALEDAYGSKNAYQDPEVLNYNDEYQEFRDLSRVPIVHLHGYVGREDDGYIFSNAEYARNIKSINPWMVVLGQFLSVEPFIIAGASLDEVDLEYYLARRSDVTSREDRGPSILVEPFPDGVTEQDCKKYNLTLFKGTSEEFFQQLNAAVPRRPTPLGLVPAASKSLFPDGTSSRLLIPFHSDFERVTGDAKPDKSSPTFLYGNSPSWGELAASLDISRDGTNDVVSYVSEALAGKRKDKLVILAEETGSGKTTVIRRVGYELALAGISVLNCSPLSRLESALAAEAIDLIDDPLVVLVDNFADQAFAISDIIDRVDKSDVVFVCAEREYRWRYIEKALGGLNYGKVGGLALGQLQARRLIDLYARFGLAGNQAVVARRDSLAKEIAVDPIAVACCRILGDFRPLERIVDSVCTDANDVEYRRYLVSALAQHCFRGGVRYEILADVAGRGGWDRQFEQHHPLPLSYFERTDKSYIVPMNATLAERVLRRARDSDILFEVFTSLANAIAPRVNRGAIMRRTPEARLAGRLFDLDAVVEEFLGSRSRRFYAETQEAWQWNSRYWEQVALLDLSVYHANPNSADGKFALKQAAQHARHAVATEEHPLSLTTLGKVLLAHLNEVDYSKSAIYEEAFSRLTFAIEKEKRMSRVSIHPFVSLFRGTSRYIELGGAVGGKDSQTLRDLMKEASKRFRRDQELLSAVSELELAL